MMGSSPPANMIIPRIWVGNYNAAKNSAFLQANSITVVVNATKDLAFQTAVPTTKYRVPVDDSLEEEDIRNMELWAPEAVYNILKEYTQGKTILIHCAAGMQRSAALAAMTLIAIRRISTDEAVRIVREQRQIAFRPGVNFYRSIKGFEAYYNKSIYPILAEQVPAQQQHKGPMRPHLKSD